MKKLLSNQKVLIIIAAFIVIGAIIAGFIVAPKNGANGIIHKKHNSVYLAPDGSMILTEPIENGSKNLVPDNPEMPEGWIFTGWEFVDSAEEVDLASDEGRKGVGVPKSIQLDKAEYKGKKIVLAKGDPIPKDGNVVALGSGYGTKGNKVTLPLLLCGAVNITAFEAEIQYDPKQVKFIGSENMDTDLVLNNVEDDGKILLNFLSSGNTTGDVALTNLKFEIIGIKEQPVPIEVVVKNGTRLDENGEIQDAPVKVISAKIEIV